MFLLFPICVIIILLISHNSCISSNQSLLSTNKNKKEIKHIFTKMTSFQGKLLSFLDEANEVEKNASDWLTDRVFELIRIEVGPFIQNKSKNISETCKETLYKYLIYDINNHTNNTISKFHLRKFFEGASKHKSDMSTFDICKYNNFNLRNETNKDQFADSAFFIMILDQSNKKKENSEEYYFNKATEVDKIFYLRSFCFPQEKIDGKDSCSDNDYYNFIMQVNDDLINLLQLKDVAEIEYFILQSNDLSRGVIFARVIPSLIMTLQIIIVFARQFIKYLYMKTHNNNDREKNLRLLVNNNTESIDIKKGNDMDDNDSSRINKNNKKKIALPKWLKIFSKSFNLTDNFNELFNFSLNSTDINNDSGLSYIRGLKSFSFFFLIFGLTFFTFINSISKTYSKFLMNDLLSYFLYPLFFIGLRYSPRIIFSCSGYTLSFKYVSYIQKNNSLFGVIKFFLYQIHKYIIMFLFFLFQRYSLFVLSDIGNISTRPMIKFFERNILSKPEGGMFLISFLDLTTIYSRDGNKRFNQTLIDYFWLPFNEMFFFVVGVIIISVGYKYKIRIDFFILILIPTLFVIKLIYSYTINTVEGDSYYATLYYFLFDYGKYMIHPVFNLPYYLIGMYFGLINYSVQKGITSFYKANSIQDKAMMDLQNMLSGENISTENKDEEIKDNESFQLERKQLREELVDMPFLKNSVSIIELLKKTRARILGIFCGLILIFFFFSHIVYYQSIIEPTYESLIENLSKIDETAEDLDNVAIDREYKKLEDLLLLGDLITNGAVNFMLRIDIEIVVLLIQAILFILYFKGQNFINDFFCHIFWGVFNKSYFSIILIANPLILYIFYQSETRIILNFFNLLLYSIIGACVSFLFGSIIYLFFELPYKRLIHNIFSWEEQEDIKDDDDEDDLNKEKDD